MKTNLIFLLLLCSTLLFTLSCQTDGDLETDIQKSNITGVVQKGPFNVGTTVTLYELNEDLSQTGKNFITQITDNKGTFELNDITLVSSYVSINADGFYFNEIEGSNSAASLSLTALSDISEKNTLNVNVLSHLEKPRVEYLVANGYEFLEAKSKAQKEVLNIFNIAIDDINESESLDFVSSGQSNAALLSISSIIQAFRSVGDVSELLTNISYDIREDGMLDNLELQTALISQAFYVEQNRVEQNLKNKYSDENVSTDFQGFKTYFEHFLNNSNYIREKVIHYPEASANYGSNILHEANTVFKFYDYPDELKYSMCAQTVEGIELKIELSVLSGDVSSGAWGYRSNTQNWLVSSYDFVNHKQIFEIEDPNLPADLCILFFKKGCTIQIKYIEGAVVRTKEITIE